MSCAGADSRLEPRHPNRTHHGLVLPWKSMYRVRKSRAERRDFLAHDRDLGRARSIPEMHLSFYDRQRKCRGGHRMRSLSGAFSR